jgi:hypothetical protein
VGESHWTEYFRGKIGETNNKGMAVKTSILLFLRLFGIIVCKMYPAFRPFAFKI